MGGSDSTETNVDNIIDQTLGTTSVEAQDSTVTPVDNQNNESKTNDSKNDGQTTEDSGSTPENTVTDENNANQNETSAVNDANNETDEKDAKISQLEQELAGAKAKIESLETDAIDAQSQIQTLTKTIEDMKVETDSFKQRCIALATANKEAVVDSIIAGETFATEDAKADRKKDLMIKSMKELKSIQDNVKQSAVQRTLTAVKSPCLATEQRLNESNGNETTDTNTKDNQVVTVNDAAQEVIKRLFK